MSSFLRFSPMKPSDDWPAGSVAVLSARRGDVLGVLTYYPAWRAHVFEPAPDTIWSEGCLDEVRAHLAGLNARRQVVAVARRRAGRPTAGAAPAHEEGA